MSVSRGFEKRSRTGRTQSWLRRTWRRRRRAGGWMDGDDDHEDGARVPTESQRKERMAGSDLMSIPLNLTAAKSRPNLISWLCHSSSISIANITSFEYSLFGSCLMVHQEVIGRQNFLSIKSSLWSSVKVCRKSGIDSDGSVGCGHQFRNHTVSFPQDTS